MDYGGLIDAVVAEFDRSNVDLRAMAHGWARAASVVAIVPAFGLRAVPAPVRAMMALTMAACIAPAVRVVTLPGQIDEPWAYGLLVSAVRGLPVAVSAAMPLWAATMAGAAVDAVRNAGDTVSMPTVEGKPTVFGVPMALLASTIFLSTGGPARVVEALGRSAAFEMGIIARVASDLAAGIQISVAVAAPVLAASVVVEVSAALITRSASPAQIHSLLAPLRSYAILVVAAFSMDRMVRIISYWVGNSIG
ncbi:MAG: flagellar biosynthetic protein FliR [Polyangiaceae bacterium]|nr:flagellar biosynthetic protein FliR [Polyangiaceae bacterium]